MKLVLRRLESDSQTGRLDDRPTRRHRERINERHQGSDHRAPSPGEANVVMSVPRLHRPHRATKVRRQSTATSALISSTEAPCSCGLTLVMGTTVDGRRRVTSRPMVRAAHRHPRDERQGPCLRAYAPDNQSDQTPTDQNQDTDSGTGEMSFEPLADSARRVVALPIRSGAGEAVDTFRVDTTSRQRAVRS